MWQHAGIYFCLTLVKHQEVLDVCATVCWLVKNNNKKTFFFFQTCFRMFVGNLYHLNCLHTLSCLSIFLPEWCWIVYSSTSTHFSLSLKLNELSASTIFHWACLAMLDVSITTFLVQERQDNGFIRETDELLFKSHHSFECLKPRQLTCIWQLSHSSQSCHKQAGARWLLFENS